MGKLFHRKLNLRFDLRCARVMIERKRSQATPVSAETLYQLANLILAVSALGVATLIVVAIGRRRAWQPEPLGIMFCLVFLAVGVRAAVRVWTGNAGAGPPAVGGMGWGAAAAAGAVPAPGSPARG